MTTTVTTALVDGALYLGDNGRIMCADASCAGSTARHTGRDLSGQRVTRVTTDDVAEWADYDLGPMRCEGGHVELTAIAGPDGFPVAR